MCNVVCKEFSCFSYLVSDKFYLLNKWIDDNGNIK